MCLSLTNTCAAPHWYLLLLLLLLHVFPSLRPSVLWLCQNIPVPVAVACSGCFRRVCAWAEGCLHIQQNRPNQIHPTQDALENHKLRKAQYETTQKSRFIFTSSRLLSRFFAIFLEDLLIIGLKRRKENLFLSTNSSIFNRKSQKINGKSTEKQRKTPT